MSLRLLSPARVESPRTVFSSSRWVAGVGNAQRAHACNWHRRWAPFFFFFHSCNHVFVSFASSAEGKLLSWQHLSLQIIEAVTGEKGFFFIFFRSVFPSVFFPLSFFLSGVRWLMSASISPQATPTLQFSGAREVSARVCRPLPIVLRQHTCRLRYLEGSLVSTGIGLSDTSTDH